VRVKSDLVRLLMQTLFLFLQSNWKNKVVAYKFLLVNKLEDYLYFLTILNFVLIVREIWYFY